MPLRYHLYKKEPWHSKGLRVLPVDNYLTFYLPAEAKTADVILKNRGGNREQAGNDKSIPSIIHL
jgi:toxin ParE1/3/4